MGISGTSSFSRVTVVGAGRSVDLVLPSTQPVGLLMPDLLQLVGDEPAGTAHGRRLVRTGGDALAPETTLAEAGISDGAVLWLVDQDATPAPPLVHDVVTAAAEDHDRRAGRWGPAARRRAATAGVALACTGIAWLLARAGAGPRSLAVTALAVALAGIAATRVRAPVGSALTLGGGGAALVAVEAAAGAAGWSLAGRLVAGAAVVAVVTVLLGLTSPLGRDGVTGGGVLLVLAAAWGAGAWAGLPADRLAALMAVLASMLLGLLPRFALSASGLVTLDDRRAGGLEVPRQDVATALDAAHRGLVIATAGTAASAVLAGRLLLDAPTPWSVALAACLCALLATRARAYPLTGEVLALLAGAGTLLAMLLVPWAGGGTPAGPVAVLGLVLVALLALLAVEPPEHVRARLRRAGDLVEAVAVAAAIPLAVGVLGVYGRLLGAF
jgi:type VII secretion integral membrane protein EccD